MGRSSSAARWSALQLLRLAVFHISVIRSPRLRGTVRKGMGEYSISDLADLFPVSKPTVYRTLNRHVPLSVRSCPLPESTRFSLNRALTTVPVASSTAISKVNGGTWSPGHGW